ncbi:MAG: hypothetical protein KGD63_00705, partial [Candidatus Lokiarchaeota archaeon]|nr:hypothetical protein [Candidatus Lokiarchaeota archaeon]
EKRHYITYSSQSRALPILKEKYPEYRWVYSKVLQTTLKKLDANYQSFFSLWKKRDKIITQLNKWKLFKRGNNQFR